MDLSFVNILTKSANYALITIYYFSLHQQYIDCCYNFGFNFHNFNEYNSPFLYFIDLHHDHFYLHNHHFAVYNHHNRAPININRMLGYFFHKIIYLRHQNENMDHYQSYCHNNHLT